MKALLDEQLDARLRTALSEFEIYTLLDFGWLGLKNGELREMVNLHQFDFLISADKNMPFQQNLSKLNFTLVLLDTPSMLFQTQLLFVPKLKLLLSQPPNPLPKIIHVGVAGTSLGKRKSAILKLAGNDQVIFL